MSMENLTMHKNQEKYKYYAALGEFLCEFSELELTAKLLINNEDNVKVSFKTNISKKSSREIINEINKLNISHGILNESVIQFVKILDVRNSLFHNGVIHPITFPVSADIIFGQDDSKIYYCDLNSLIAMINDIKTITNSMMFYINQKNGFTHLYPINIYSHKIGWKYLPKKY